MTAATSPRFLLLIPTPPPQATLSTYKTAFGETIGEVLKEVALHAESGQQAPVLEIAVACPSLVGKFQAPRATLYDGVQKQLALLYKLIAILASAGDVDVETDSGVDVRLIPLAWAAELDDAAEINLGYGPVITLTVLARSGRDWQYAFGVESTEGEKMVSDFVKAKSNISDTVTGSGVQLSASRSDSTLLHHDVAVGGTFDHLHIGHKLLLTMTVFAADTLESGNSSSVTIGITGDELLKNKKFAEVLESWDTRQKKVEDFCDSLIDFTAWPAQKSVNSRDDPGPNGKSVDLIYGNGLEVKCTQIQDPFGPTITDKSISALIISAETRSGGTAVNEKRKDKQWPELQVFEVDVLDAKDEETDGAGQTDFATKLSSTAIRQKLASRRA